MSAGRLTNVYRRLAPQQQLHTLILVVQATVMQGGVAAVRLLI